MLFSDLPLAVAIKCDCKPTNILLWIVTCMYTHVLLISCIKYIYIAN